MSETEYARERVCVYAREYERESLSELEREIDR